MSDIEDLPDAPPAPREIMEDMNTDAFGPNRILSEEDLNREYPNRPKNEKTTLPFHELHKFLFDPLLANKGKKTGPAQRASKLKPHEIRRNIIDRFISRWRGEVGNDIYPALRLILCEKDRDRSVYASPTLLNKQQLTITPRYHLKEKSIGRLLVKVMKINKDSDDGYALLNWRQPGASRTAGDFALRCHGTLDHHEIYICLLLILQISLTPNDLALLLSREALPNIVAHIFSTSVLENYRTNVRFRNPEVIKKRPMRTTPGNLKIAQVNEMLDRLSQASKEWVLPFSDISTCVLNELCIYS